MYRIFYMYKLKYMSKYKIYMFIHTIYNLNISN